MPLAGELQGAHALGEGTEVVVSFIEGDPDQPMICGFLAPPETVEVLQVSAAPVEGQAGAGMLDLLRSGEPLMLLCLLPGGGSFSHCAEALCTCRVLLRSGQSGAA